jgi:hypothetical protein
VRIRALQEWYLTDGSTSGLLLLLLPLKLCKQERLKVNPREK